MLKDGVIVPMSQYEIVVAGPNPHTCCTNHGYVVSLDPKDGSQQWRYDTMPEAKPVRDRGDGKFLYGPSGAPIWDSPAINEKLGLVYVGTGESNSPPLSLNTDAIIAMGSPTASSGGACRAPTKTSISPDAGHILSRTSKLAKDTVYRDVDFGASLVLAPLANGKEAMFAGQKSGTVWAVDPATGVLLWRNDLGVGSPLGGIH